MIIVRILFNSVRFTGLFLAWFLCANIAAADAIHDTGPPDVSNSNSWFGNVPPSELNGWFFDSNQPPSFPFQLDPGQPWTSAENIAILNHWLSVVAEMGDDAPLVAELKGLGIAITHVGSKNQVNPSNPVTSQNLPSDVPEPETLALLCAGLMFSGAYTAVRARRMQGAEIN
jgi:hypothetical protein